MGAPAWETSSDGAAPQTRPLDLAALHQHKAQCTDRSGRWVSLRCGTGRLVGFLSARLVTLAALLAALALAWLAWR